MSCQLMKMSVAAADDEVERERDEQQASDHVEDKGRNLFLSWFGPLVARSCVSREAIGVSLIDVAGLDVRHRAVSRSPEGRAECSAVDNVSIPHG